MPRTGGVFSLLSGSKGSPNTTIQSVPYNSQLDDFAQDANLARPITAGGTGATTASAARTNLGLAIGTNVQAYDAGLLSIAGLTTSANQMVYTTALDVYATTALTPFARTILDDADAATVRTTLGLGTLSTLSAVNDANWSGADLSVANGGTGSSTAAAARTALGAQAQSASLDSLSGLTTAADRLPYTTAADTWAVSVFTAFGRSLIDDANAAAARATLGLGSISTLSSINNANWSGTALSVANGGTGATDASTARDNLGIGATIWAYIARRTTTTGSNIDFTSIPSSATEIEIIFNGVSLSGGDQILVQLGVSGTPETSGYSSVGSRLESGVVSSSASNGFLIRSDAAGYLMSGAMQIKLNANGSNLWVSDHSLIDAGASSSTFVGAGSKALAGTLNMVRITRSGTNTFDAGSIDLRYR